MNFPVRFRAGFLVLVCVCAAAPVFATEKVLYSFAGIPDGSIPLGTLIADKAGNLYGITQQGGTGICIEVGNVGCGTVFELSPPTSRGGSWTETVLYSFQGGADGWAPLAGLVWDAQGNLYGTTWATNSFGEGTVFELSPPATSGGAWSLTTLHTFKGADGAGPAGSLIFDKSGNLYGTTVSGGYYVGVQCTGFGCGTVFELSPPAILGGPWTENVLHAFTAGLDGANPKAGLVMDTAGNLYGTTYSGGDTRTNPCTSAYGGCGTVFQLHPSAGSWTEHILHRFNFTDGDRPLSTLVFYKGALYGTTSEAEHYGSVFQLAVSAGKSTLTSIFTFNLNDGSGPLSGVVVDKSGNLFGVTNGGSGSFYGNVYELSPPTTSGGSWSQTILHSFTSGTDSAGPQGGLLQGGNTLYGTTSGVCNTCSGGYGTVFAVTK